MLSVPLHTLCEYTKATPSSRNMIEGQKVINSGMIIMCGATVKAPERIELYSLVLQTSALTSEPHLIRGVFLLKHLSKNDENDVEVIVEKMDCSCKAGTSHSCKHIVAVLLYCNRNNLCDLEMVSSTDQKCLWKKHKLPVLEQFQTSPTRTFCCIKQERLPPLSTTNLNIIRNRLIDCDSESAVAKHRLRNLTVQRSQRIPFQEILNHIHTSVSDLNNNTNSTSATVNDIRSIDFTNMIINNAMESEVISVINAKLITLKRCCKDLYNKIIACEDVKQVAMITKESIVEWKKERRYRITGSRCYQLYTYSETNDWKSKALKYFWSREFKNKYTMHGNMYESVARESYAKQTGTYVHECGLIICSSEPWLGYSADGIVIKNGKILKLLEIKCPYELGDTNDETLLSKCKFLFRKNNVLNLKVKHQYYGQVQFGMALLNLQKCDFVVYSNCSNSLKIISVDFNKEFAIKLLVNLKKKYFQKMLHEICCQSRVEM